MKRALTLAFGGSMYAVLALLAEPALAADLDQDQARNAQRKGLIISYQNVLAILRSTCHCEVLKAKLHHEEYQSVEYLIYDLKAIDDQGRIIKLEIDAATGAIMDLKRK